MSFMKSRSETVSIRFDQEQLCKLDQRRKPFGDSRGEHVKRMALAALLELEQMHLADMLQQLRLRVDSIDDEQSRLMVQLNDRLKRLTFVLLSTVGKLSTDEARQTARKLFPSVDEHS